MAWAKGTSNKVKIYGIKRLLSSTSPAWTRTDDAVGLTATPSIGSTTIGKSDFDNIYPWSGMTRSLFETGDIMTIIPRFWYKRWQDASYEYIQIASKQANSDFKLHPGSNRYYGSYRSGVGYANSIAGSQIWNDAQTSGTNMFQTFRNLATKKGPNWYCMDIAGISALRILYLVEYATNDSQSAIGRGVSDVSGTANMKFYSGTCDNVANLTGRAEGTDGKVDVIYRGIETPWGTGQCFIDGLLVQQSNYYFTTEPSKFTSEEPSDYNVISYTQAAGYPYRNIKRMGYDSNYPWFMMPVEVTGENDHNNYYNDFSYTMINNYLRRCMYGGMNYSGSGAGIFCTVIDSTYVYSYIPTCWRLMYIPEE